ncbi:LysE/ArgO family amino acid transporter [Fusobacterium ulcerans]|uniref:LysE/ArgO family amino acid transporter n=1 Tax=Fusobacterium ulcerans TaxID=861 RepID=UPI00241D2B34|nr:LysE family transporter [Fusobacterium ulcerans]MEE0139663.1 LysE family transporter [Fusobacterium ulcerans]
MKYLLQGLTMGLAYVAPIGLQNLFVINTALTQKRSRAFMTAFIVIFFDVTLALACFFGIGSIMEKSKLLERGILLVGSFIVIYIGIGLVKAKGSLNNSTEVNIPLIKVVTTACVVTWFNPQAIIDGSMMLGAFRASLPPGEGMKFISGVAFASCMWFIGMTIFITCFSSKITEKVLRIINIVCGAVIIFYGIKLFYSFIQMVI